MLSVYVVNASGVVALLGRDLASSEAVALADAHYEKTGGSAILVAADPEGGAADV